MNRIAQNKMAVPGLFERALRAQAHPPMLNLRIGRALTLMACLLLLASLRAEGPEGKRISIYAQQTSYTLPVPDRDGKEYVGILEILEPLGSVDSKIDGKKLKLKFNDIEGQFTQGKDKAKVRGRDISLSAPFLIENGRGLVPVHSIPDLILRYTGTSSEFHETSRRLFLGNLATQYSTSLSKVVPSRLILTFSAPVNPFVGTEPGKVHLLFTREPLKPSGKEPLSFDDKLIPSLSYSENNGAAEITVQGTVPLSVAFSDGNRTITIAAMLPTTPPVAPPPVTTPPATGQLSAQQPAVASTPKPPLVIIDAGHGGDERGAALSAKLAEKDVALEFARRLVRTLEAQGITTRLLRDSDQALTAEQRAVLANASRALVYISTHVGTTGAGVRVYTAMLQPATKEGIAFTPWETAQSSYLNSSRTLASTIATELLKRDISAVELYASVPPLNNIATTALAIEIAAPQHGTVSDIESASYQQSVSSAVAVAIAASRARLEAQR